MSILGNIMSSILGGRAQPPPAATTPPEQPHAPVQAAAQHTPPSPAPAEPTAPASAAPHAGTPPSSAAPPPQVDVAAVLDQRAEEAGQQLNWRTSIVDLMKLLELDSGLDARRTLATELNYTGSTNDTAAMNVWLHKQVMAKLEQNGGKLPPDVTH